MDLAQVGRYRVVRNLGRGGMGEVYEAEDTKLGRRVALKFLSSSLSSDAQALDRFQREARAASSLNHPNICVIYEIDEHEGRPFIAMELLEGRTLRNKINGVALPLDEVLDFSIQICEGLDAAHTKSIIHRDLKPENLFVTERQQVKILDFGLAKFAFDTSCGPDSPTVGPTAQLSSAGSTFGTVAYMSPEQVLGKPLDVRTDLFSFGVVLYEMATGSVLFPGETTGAIFDEILHKTLTSVRNANATFPEELDRVVAKALEKDRELRYQSAAEIRADLKRLKRDIESRTGSGSTAAARTSHHPKKTLTAIAVLPFENANADPSYEYLSDGLTETIIDELSQIPKLSVVARSTVFRYKKRELDPQSLGRELKVGAVITGRLIRRGDMLTVAVEMVDTSSGLRLWGERYNRRAEDLLAIENDIGRQITERLRTSLSGKTSSRARRTRNTGAYEAYLKGRYYWSKRTESELRKGAECFEQAIALDPSYALAYAGLADFYIILGWYSYVPPQDCFPKARAAATKALEIESNLAEAHNAMGFISLLYEWDMPASEQHFRRALEVNPKYAAAHHWYSDFLAANGRMEESKSEAQRAHELDPLNLIINWNLGWNLYFSRRFNESIAQFKNTLELDANYMVAYMFLGQAYVEERRYAEAEEAFQRTVELSQEAAVGLGLLGHCRAKAGRREEALKILAELEERSKRAYVSPVFFAWIHLGLGDREQALTWLERAGEERSNWLAWLNAEPRYDSLRGDPRFGELVRKVGLSQKDVKV